VRASIALGILKIPVWIVDIGDNDHPAPFPLGNEAKLEIEEARSGIRCYSTANSRLMIRDVVESARTGTIGFGIKGTRHVAVVGHDGLEVKLEIVTPRISWGEWKSSGRLNATDGY
jgi:hypothetical protein